MEENITQLRMMQNVMILNVKDIYEIFEEVAKSDYAFSKQFYDYKGVKYIPYEENIALQNQVKALARITANEYVNFSNTLAFTKRVNGRVVYTDLARTYQDTLDKAILSVAQGKSTFDEQMYSTIKELALVSKFPVASSASIIAGLVINALPIETLCCSPPLNSFGK